MLRAWVGLIAIIGLVVGCRKEPPSPRLLDENSPVWLRILPKVEAAAGRPAADAAFAQLASGVLADPKLLFAASTLVTELSSDPKISAPVEALLTELGDSPEVQAQVMRLMAEHPEATPDQIGELVGAEFEKVWDSKPVTDAWMAAFNLFLGKLRGRPEGKRALALIDAIDVPSLGDARLAKWSKRLETLERKRLEGTAAEDAYLRHAWSDARIDAFLARISKNQALHRITAQALSELLADKALRGDLRTAAAEMVSDPTIKARIATVMLSFTQEEPPIAKIRIALTELMTTPALIEASGKLVTRVLDNPEVRRIVGRWYQEFRKDPTIGADFVEFVDGW